MLVSHELQIRTVRKDRLRDLLKHVLGPAMKQSQTIPYQGINQLIFILINIVKVIKACFSCTCSDKSYR